jgi:hypothetical protein
MYIFIYSNMCTYTYTHMHKHVDIYLYENINIYTRVQYIDIYVYNVHHFLTLIFSHGKHHTDWESFMSVNMYIYMHKHV